MKIPKKFIVFSAIVFEKRVSDHGYYYFCSIYQCVENMEGEKGLLDSRDWTVCFVSIWSQLLWLVFFPDCFCILFLYPYHSSINDRRVSYCPEWFNLQYMMMIHTLQLAMEEALHAMLGPPVSTQFHQASYPRFAHDGGIYFFS